MEDHSIQDQLRIAASARHVVGLHGAAMALLAVNRNIESLIELCPPSVYHEYFPVSLGTRVKRYFQTLPEFDILVACSGWDAIVQLKNLPFSVNTSTLTTALAEAHP